MVAWSGDSTISGKVAQEAGLLEFNVGTTGARRNMKPGRRVALQSDELEDCDEFHTSPKRERGTDRSSRTRESLEPEVSRLLLPVSRLRLGLVSISADGTTTGPVSETVWEGAR